MIRQAKDKLVNWLTKRGLHKKDFVNQKIASTTYKVIKGTLRDQPDKDDAWIYQLGKHAEIIFDVGSNIGQSALLMLHHASVERILLVDPNPKALAMAAENLMMNQLISMKATFIPAFLSNKVGGTVDFYTVGAGAAGSRYKEHAKTAARLNEHFEVSTLTIDFLTAYYALIPDFVKIDVEGAEVEVLRGAINLAKRRATQFFVEVHSTPDIVENTESIITWCSENNYDAYYLKDHERLLVNSIKDRGRYHALLIPSGTLYPPYLMGVQQGSSISK